MALVSLLFFGFGAAFAAPADRIAAVVNDEVVTLSEVYEMGRDFIETRAQSGLAGERRTAELEVLDSLIPPTVEGSFLMVSSEPASEPAWHRALSKNIAEAAGRK